jgi:glycosyltransferase involved in cell wall biosynthesis
MRIAFDLTSWSNRRGYGRFTRGLVGALVARASGHEWLLFVDESQAAAAFPAGARPIVVATREPASRGLRAGARRPLSVVLALGRAVAAERPDWLVFPSVYSYFPPPRRCRVVVGIHDVIPEDHPRLVFPRAGERLLWRAKSWAARRRADAVLTVSEFARDGLVRRFGLAAEKIWVVEEAADPVFRPLAPHEVDHALLARLGLGDGGPVIGYVGGFNPHKNLGALVDALAELRQRPAFGALRLVLVGDLDDPFTPGRAEVEARIRARGLERAILFTGFLSDAELVQALNAVRVLALPSLAEGFGLSAVEAAACGTPVVATRSSPLPELLAGGGRFVDPGRPGELVAALGELVADPALAARLGATARERAARLGWERTAERFLAALARTAGAG